MPMERTTSRSRAHFYSSAGFTLEPTPAHARPPSGSGAGARADAWRALPTAGWPRGSQHEPGAVRPGLVMFQAELAARGAAMCAVPSGIASRYRLRARAEAMLADAAAPLLNRPVEPLRAILPIGCNNQAAGRCGRARVFLWPRDERAQLEVFRERVVPLIDGERTSADVTFPRRRGEPRRPAFETLPCSDTVGGRRHRVRA